MNSTEFRRAMGQLPPVPTNVPAHTWPAYRLSLRKHAWTDEPERLLSWGTVAATMFVGSHEEFTETELASLSERYISILPEIGFGDPQLLRFGNIITSGNIIHQAYHLMQFEQVSGVKVETLKSVVEFGGGYGLMAVLFKRLGFAGQYTIIDLPELSLIQQYYLSNTIGLDGIELIDNYDGQLLRQDLFWAVHSISEAPLDLRSTLLKRIRARYRFMAHHDRFTGQDIDNVAYFADVAKRYKLRHWRSDILEGHWYLGNVTS